MSEQQYVTVPPLMWVHIADSADLVEVDHMTHRAGMLAGFESEYQERLDTAARELATLVLHTRARHELNVNGVKSGCRTGLQVSCAVDWLSNAPADRVELALRSRIGPIVDEVSFTASNPPVISFMIWNPNIV